MSLETVPIEPVSPQRFEALLGERWPVFERAITQAQRLLEGRSVWNVNSTATGGGVAEMLAPLVGYIKGTGIRAEWIAIDADASFFRVTKRLHNKLHGVEGDGGALGADEKNEYERTLSRVGAELDDRVSPGDVVILHDPQTAGLASTLKANGAIVIWRCHVGLDNPNHHSREAWDFLRPWVTEADAYVFSRQVFVWEDLDDEKIAIIAPSIDAFSAKNQHLDTSRVDAILRASGVISGPPAGAATFTRSDDKEGTVRSIAKMGGAGPIHSDARLVVQVSRWDGLKDPLGVIEGFASHLAAATDTHLVLAGPSVAGVADDPEGAQVLADAERFWGSLDRSTKERVHLAVLPMEDPEENAAIVNALQRRADVVVQKSLAEGFGLTVAEAMWKARPVVASRIGGIQDQVVHGETGLLLDDPRDLESFAASVNRFLSDPAYARRIGEAARERVKQDFLGPRHLMQYLDLIERLLRVGS